MTELYSIFISIISIIYILSPQISVHLADVRAECVSVPERGSAGLALGLRPRSARPESGRRLSVSMADQHLHERRSAAVRRRGPERLQRLQTPAQRHQRGVLLPELPVQAVAGR